MPKGHFVQQNSFSRGRTSPAPCTLHVPLKHSGLTHSPEHSQTYTSLYCFRSEAKQDVTCVVLSPTLPAVMATHPDTADCPLLPPLGNRILFHTSELIRWDSQVLATLKRWSFQASTPRLPAQECHLLLLCNDIKGQ